MSNSPMKTILEASTTTIRSKPVTCNHCKNTFTSTLRKLGPKHFWSECPSCLRESYLKTGRLTATPCTTTPLNQQEATQYHLEKQLQQAGFPKRFLDKTLENFNVCHPSQQRSLTLVKDYIKGFPIRLKQGASMIFCGRSGTGKTHVAAGLARRVLDQGHSVQYCNVSNALSDIKSYWGTSERHTRQAVTAFTKPDLLILDDVGVQSLNVADKNLLFNIVDQRFQDVKPTLMATILPIENQGPSSLRVLLGDYMVNRLRQNGGQSVPFSWATGQIH